MKWYEKVAEAGKKFVKGAIEVTHVALDAAGFIPVAGAIPDLVNLGIYALEGDWKNAVFSAAAAVPAIGDAAAVGKVVKRIDGVVDGAKLLDKAVDGAKVLDKAVDGAKVLDKAADGAKLLDKAIDAMKGFEILPKLEKLKPILNVLMGKLDKLFDLLDIPESLRELLMKLLGDTSGLVVEGGKLLSELSMKEKLKLINLANKINNLFKKNLGGVKGAGKLTQAEIDYLIKTTIDEGQMLKDMGLTNKELGPAIAGAYDIKTGKIYTAINDKDGVIPNKLHPLLQERIANMPDAIFESYKKTHGAGSHAEIYAANKALLANPDASISDITIYVNRTLGSSKPVKEIPFHTCPHCEYILQGFNIISDIQ